MNNDLLKRYIDDQPTKIITKLDFATGKLSYDKIVRKLVNCKNKLQQH